MRRGALAVLAALWPVAVAAADLEALFPPDEAVCYARDYDAAYLERHPEQRVTSMRIVRPLDPALQRLEAEERENLDTTGVALARIGVTLRSTGSEMWTGYFSCTQSKDGRKSCSSGECDGGAMMIEASPGGATVYFDPDPASYRRHFVVVGCDSAPESGSIAFSIETDSAPFLLERVPLSQCGGVDVAY